MKLDYQVGHVLERRHHKLLDVLHRFVIETTPQIPEAEALAALDLEIANVVDVGTSLIESQLKPDTERLILHTLTSLLVHLDDYMTLRGMTTEKFRWAKALFGVYLADRIEPPHPLYNALGRVLSERGEDETAIEFYTHALETCNLADDDLEKARLWNNFAISLWSVGRLEEALIYTRRAERIIRKEGTARESVMLMSNLSQILADLGDLQGGLLTGFAALEQVQQIDDKRLQGQIVSLNARHMMANGLRQEALPIFQQALALHVEVDDQPGMVVTALNYAILLHLLEDDEKAHQFAAIAHELAEALEMVEESRQALNLLITLDQNDSAADTTNPPEVY